MKSKEEIKLQGVLTAPSFSEGNDIRLILLNKTVEELRVDYVEKIDCSQYKDGIQLDINNMELINAGVKHIEAVAGSLYNYRMRADIWSDGTVFGVMPGGNYSASSILREYAAKHSNIMCSKSIPLMSLIMTSDSISIFRDSDTYLPYTELAGPDLIKICTIFKQMYTYYGIGELKLVKESRRILKNETGLHFNVKIFNGLVRGCERSFWSPIKYVGEASICMEYSILI